MIELKDELLAMPVDEWHALPYTVNRHKWWLKMYRFGGNGSFLFCFESPKKRRYAFWAERGRVPNAYVALANGTKIARYWEGRCNRGDNMDAVLRLTPKHILSRLYMLLDAIG